MLREGIIENRLFNIGQVCFSCVFNVYGALKKCFSNWRVYYNQLEGLLKQIAGATLIDSDSAGLGCGLGICILNMLPGEADTALVGTHFENHRSHLEQETSIPICQADHVMSQLLHMDDTPPKKATFSSAN